MEKLKKDRFIAWVGYSNENSIIWGQHERLFDFIFEEYSKTKRRFDEISMPTLYILSHAIELGLKENIIFFRKYHKSNHLSKYKNFAQLIKSHDLKSLSKELKTAYYKLHKKIKGNENDKITFNRYFHKLQSLIDILERNTETYRYAFKIDKDGKIIKDSLAKTKKVNFIEINELFKSVKTLLVGAVNSLAIYTDYIDFIKGNSEYKKKGKGYLYCPKLLYSQNYFEEIKKKLNKQLKKISENKWIDIDKNEIYEVIIWDNYIYIIALK